MLYGHCINFSPEKRIKEKDIVIGNENITHLTATTKNLRPADKRK